MPCRLGTKRDVVLGHDTADIKGPPTHGDTNLIGQGSIRITERYA